MTNPPPRGSSDGGAPGPARARQADAGLDRLMADLLTARDNMRAALAIRPSDGRQQELVRARLLECLEAYTAGLTARGLSAPPVLRDELALQRNLVRPVTKT